MALVLKEHRVEGLLRVAWEKQGRADHPLRGGELR